MGNAWGSVDTSSKSEVLKLQARTQIRVGSDPETIDVHLEDDFVGNIRRVNCPGAGCPLCKVGKAPNKRYAFKVINRADGQAHILECGVMIIKEIKKYALEEGYGNPTSYDIVITKTGTGKQTRYSVMPLPAKSEITASEAQALAEIDISKYIKPTSIEAIKGMGLRALPFEVVNNEPDSNFDDNGWNEL